MNTEEKVLKEIEELINLLPKQRGSGYYNALLNQIQQLQEIYQKL